MRVFESGVGCFSCKLNIVDDNNVFVGFDYSSCCCESFGYKITNEEPTSFEHLKMLEELGAKDFPGFNFDTTYMNNFGEVSGYNEGNSVTFKAVNGAGEALFISLMNSHNGYYSHGFGMKVGKRVVFEGSL